MGANFITGTGTDIGKTWLACALLRHWRRQGRQPAACKPLLSGFDPAALAESDAGQLLAALGQAPTMDRVAAICPWRYAAPLSPDMAAAREGKTIDFDALVAYTRRTASADFSHTLVEGVGGVMVPLDAKRTVRDWIAASGLPCVLVAGSYLGSMSHALTALEALSGAGIPVAALAVNESADSTVALDATVESLMRHAGHLPVVGLARARPEAGISRLADLLC